MPEQLVRKLQKTDNQYDEKYFEKKSFFLSLGFGKVCKGSIFAPTFETGNNRAE